ncbi:MAG: hypothetical protein A2939_00045 [Parcubacteria group bacterium RIFCSPLOWO2_01_FULL_48_18]|nr:MAG: hypothetical protein A3J67_06010 [Parcubacteria group bacterium RIFCSPHIGHO2_02_FULL_48_10b]OHB22158.1 MAG: hypothetical protein A2939_00045 [Parcubacteria group bacterium RIFCSPLOWO2_01_FULL_48_18]
MFHLEVVGEDLDDLSRMGGIATITVKKGDKSGKLVTISVRQFGKHNQFRATDKIEGVPMRTLGDGIWQYIIDI